MKRYQTLEPVTFRPPRIGLSDAQAERRKHALKPAGKGTYAPTADLCFKTGEIIALESVSKALAPRLREIPPEKKAEKCSPKTSISS
jgi:hypothetical protein